MCTTDAHSGSQNQVRCFSATERRTNKFIEKLFFLDSFQKTIFPYVNFGKFSKLIYICFPHIKERLKMPKMAMEK